MATPAQRLLEDLITAEEARGDVAHHNLLPATVAALDRTAACVHRHMGSDPQPDQTAPQETVRSLRRRLNEQVISALKWAREQPLGLRTPLCGTPFELTESLIVSLVCSFALLTKEVSAAPLRCIPAVAEPVVTKVGKLHGLELDWSDEREWGSEADEARGGPKLRAWWRWATHLINVSRGNTLALHPPATRRPVDTAAASHQQVVVDDAAAPAAAEPAVNSGVRVPESTHQAAFQAPAPPPQELGAPAGYGGGLEQQYGSPQAPSIPLPPVPFLQSPGAAQPQQQSISGYGPQPPAYDPLAQAIMGGHDDQTKRHRDGDGLDRNHRHHHRHEGSGRQRYYNNHGKQQ